MRLTYFASSGRIWDKMPWEARLQFLQAVFFTFSGVGFLLDLANPRPGRIAHIVFLVFMGGAIGVAYGFCFMRAPKLLPVLLAMHVVLAIVLTPHLGSLALDWAKVASTAAGVDLVGCLFAILLGYVFFVRFVRKQGLRYFRVQTEIELAEQIHRTLVPPIVRHASLEDRKSTRLNSSHPSTSYAVFCLKKKNYDTIVRTIRQIEKTVVCALHGVAA